MRAATLRRSIVFAVCALGVGALYLAPGIARSPDQLGARRPSDEPTGRTLTTSDAPTPTAKAGRRADGGDREPTADRAEDRPPRAETTLVSDRRTGARPSSRGATPFDPQTRGDEEPPQPVATIRPAEVTADRLTVDWTKAEDNVGVIGYHVWLNGFDVASTAETHATISWFNDDTSQQVVQVKAVDAAGNRSPSSPSLLVTRPDPEPTPGPTEPTPAPTEEPTPTPSPTPSPSPTDAGSVGPQVAPSATASTKAGAP